MSQIPRSTGARRHGPTKARRPVGDLQGPPEGVSRQVRIIDVRVEQLDDGRWKVTQPRVPAWGAVVRSPGELAAALRRGFTESQVAAHSNWRGHIYDGAAVTYKRSRPTARSRKRCDVYSADMWSLDPDKPGVWVSPKGFRYPEERQVVQRVMAARKSMGLAERPDPVNPSPSAAVTSMTARNVHTMKQRGKTA
jgi:hypothetical protein